MRTSNPALKAFVNQEIYAGARSNVMTIRGTVIKTGVLTAICAIAAVFTWSMLRGGSQSEGLTWGIGGALAAAVCGLVLFFAPRTAPYVSPVYAAAEGLFVGAISYLVPVMYNKAPEGVVIQAVMLTFGILFALLAAYGAGLVRIGGTARKVILVATAGICFYYIAGVLMQMMGIPIIRLGWDAGPMGIGFSIVVVVIASLNLVLDFQYIEAGAANGAPKYMEWYAGYGLLVTLVWLYIESLRLLSKLRK
jgi:uncharacterized YccA/Bax inhibitor family protein